MLTKAVFFDRDDTLIQDTGYMYKIADFKWIDGAIPALSLLRDAHIPIFDNSDICSSSVFVL